MELGLFSLMTLRDHPGGARGVFADTRYMVQQAEEAGFDIAWFAEHHFANYSVSPSPLMMAAYAAGWTKRIKLGPGVIVLPLYNPLRVAQEIAMLDIQAGGRSVIGIGTGYQQFEFARFGVPIEDKVEIFLEYWAIVESALTTGVVEHSGKHISVPRTSFAVRTLQTARIPPVYIASSQPALLERFKHLGAVPWIAASTLGSRVLYNMADALDKNWLSVGCDPSSQPLAIMQYKSMSPTAGPRPSKTRGNGRDISAAWRIICASAIFRWTAPSSATSPSRAGALEGYARNTILGDVTARVGEAVRSRTSAASGRTTTPATFSSAVCRWTAPVARSPNSAAEVLPLMERELGPIAALGRGIASVSSAAE